MHPNRVFYGWWLAIASFGVLFYTAGVFFYGFAPFFAEIIDEFGWPTAVASIAFAFQRTEQGISVHSSAMLWTVSGLANQL